MLTGEAEPTDTMGAEDDMDMEPTTDMEGGDEVDMDMETGDDFDASEPATGGEEPMGREQRESVQHSKKKLK
jgi:hypothetical protein